MLAVNINYTINIGDIIQVASILGGGAYLVISLRATVDHVKRDMVDMKTEIKKLGDVLIKLAVTDTRLTNLEQDIRELKHGEGFVLPLGSTK